MDMVKGRRETKSLEVGLSMSVALTVLPETVILIFMLRVPLEEAACGIQLSASARASASKGLEPHLLMFILFPPCHHSMGFRSRKNPPVGPSSGNVASQTAVSAPSSGLRDAPCPPIRVRTQPG